MDWSEIFLTAVLTVGLFMSAMYVASMVLKDASIVDIVWGVGFVLIAGSLLIADSEIGFIRGLVSLYVLLWGVRLAAHIFSRKIGKGEDWRYQAWRKEWAGTFWWRSYLQIFMLQGFLMIVIAAPLLIAAHQSNIDATEHVFFTTIGAALWWVGFLFESIGDWQLRQFIRGKKKKDAVMKSGLWKYTRHPNYFGEVAQWWGIWLIVAPLNFGLLALVSPLTITFLMLKVSGIPMLEKKYDDNKAYQTYKKATPAFFPFGKIGKWAEQKLKIV